MTAGMPARNQYRQARRLLQFLDPLGKIFATEGFAFAVRAFKVEQCPAIDHHAMTDQVQDVTAFGAQGADDFIRRGGFATFWKCRQGDICQPGAGASQLCGYIDGCEFVVCQIRGVGNNCQRAQAALLSQMHGAPIQAGEVA